jgi:hypothetical protein
MFNIGKYATGCRCMKKHLRNLETSRGCSRLDTELPILVIKGFILSHDTVPLSGLKMLPGVARLSAEGAQYNHERIAKSLTQFSLCTVFHVTCRISKIILPAKIMSRE